MESIFNKVIGFLGGLGSILLALVPVSVLWFVLTGTDIFGFDVVANLTTLVNSLGNGGFVGLIVLVILWSFFDHYGDKKK
tara:strand:- start:123 stop:362 length:240 start_codon:yes stop_codon:yes gene_type:complete